MYYYAEIAQSWNAQSTQNNKILHCVSKNFNNLIVNNFYTLEPILIIFGTLYTETTGKILNLALAMLLHYLRKH